MSYSDIARTRLATLPGLFQTAGLQTRAITSAPGVEPRTFGSWSNLVGFFNETNRTQLDTAATHLLQVKRTATVLVQDSVTLLEGSQIRVPIGTGTPTTYQIWQVSSQYQSHNNHVGTTSYSLTRDETQQSGADRGGGR